MFANNMKRTFFFSLWLSCFGWMACQKNNFFEQKLALPNHFWTYKDTLNFDFAIQDTTRIYNLYLDIEHGTDYPMQNLYVMTHTRFPGGQRPQQRINIDLADNAGKWQGEGTGSTRRIRVNLQQGAFFNVAGNYTLTLEQFMRVDSLKDIRSVTFVVEDTKKNK